MIMKSSISSFYLVIAISNYFFKLTSYSGNEYTVQGPVRKPAHNNPSPTTRLYVVVLFFSFSRNRNNGGLGFYDLH